MRSSIMRFACSCVSVLVTLLVPTVGFDVSARAVERLTPGYQDLYTDCEIPVIGAPAGRLNGHLLLRQNAVGPLCVARRIEAPDGTGEDGVLCLYQPIGNVDAWGLRQQDGSVQINVDGKVSTAGWHHVALVAQARRGGGSELVYSFVGCRPEGLVAQVISKVHAVLRVSDVPEEAFSIVIVSGANEATVKFAASPKK
jgi:hypothetical protein